MTAAASSGDRRRRRPHEHFSERGREAWAPRPRRTVSQWADDELFTADNEAEPGKYSTARTPYIRGILDAYADHRTEEITLVASTQSAKTTACFAMIGYAIAEDPGPVLYVMPTEGDVDSISANRIAPMIRSTPALARHATTRSADLRGKIFKLDTMLVRFGWAHSAASLAQMPARTVVCDETDKYPPYVGEESDPLSLAKERASNFWNRKIIKASTPTLETGYIWQEFLAGTREEYYVPCPHCRVYQALAWPQLKMPADVRDPEILERDQLVWYQCLACEKDIEFEERERMMAAGTWCPAGCSIETDRTMRGEVASWRHRSFHINKLMSPWVHWAKIAAEFLRSRRNPRKHRNFINSWLGEPWREKARGITIEKIREASIPYERCTVPDARVIRLTAGVDVQLDTMWYVIRAWAALERSWLVDYGNVRLWEEIEKRILDAKFPGPGRTYEVDIACIDARYRRDEVFKVCRKHLHRARPTMGLRELAAAPLRAIDVDKDEWGRPLRGGLQRWDVDTTYFKDRLASFITPEEIGDDGKPVASERRWWVFDTVEDHYAAQVTAEHKIGEINKRTGFLKYVWVPKTAQAANHLGDCEALALAAAEMLGVHVMEEPQPPPLPPTSQQIREKEARDAAYWGQRRGGGRYW